MIWDVEVRWDGESHTSERPFTLFRAAQAWCAQTVAELFRDGVNPERESALALVERIEGCTGESRGYCLIDEDLGVEVYLSASGDGARHLHAVS